MFEFGLHRTGILILKHDQQDATLYNNIYYCQRFTYFERFFRLSPRAQICTCSMRYLSKLLLLPLAWMSWEYAVPWTLKTAQGLRNRIYSRMGEACIVVSKLLGAFKKLRKAALSIVMSLLTSVRMELLGSHWTDFHEIWYSECFSKICRENSSFIQIWKEWRILYIKKNIYFLSYLAHFFVEWEIFQAKFVEKVKTYVFVQKLFSENRTVYEIR